MAENPRAGLQDLNDTLRYLLLQTVGKLTNLDISFDMPTRDWSARAGDRPMVNLYLYDIRENLELRDLSWEPPPKPKTATNNAPAMLTRRPVWMNISYMVTCWTKATEEQHRLLWWVLEALCRNSPVPFDMLQGDLHQPDRLVRTEVAQPNGVLKNSSEFWAALENQIRPSINLVATLDLDLDRQKQETWATGAIVDLRLSDGHEGALQPAPPEYAVKPHLVESVGFSNDSLLVVTIRDSQRQPVAASVVLAGPAPGGQEIQPQATPLPDAPGDYVFAPVAPGNYRLRVEVAGHLALEKQVSIPSWRPGDPRAHREDITVS